MNFFKKKRFYIQQLQLISLLANLIHAINDLVKKKMNWQNSKYLFSLSSSLIFFSVTNKSGEILII